MRFKTKILLSAVLSVILPVNDAFAFDPIEHLPEWYEPSPLYYEIVAELTPFVEEINSLANDIENSIFTAYNPVSFADELVNNVIILWRYFNLFDTILPGLTPFASLIAAYTLIYTIKFFLSAIKYIKQVIPLLG